MSAGENMGETPHSARVVSRVTLPAMKTNCRKRYLTFGDFIAHAYDVCGKRKARGMVWLAVKAHLIEFRGKQRLMISEDFNPGAKI